MSVLYIVDNPILDDPDEMTYPAHNDTEAGFKGGDDFGRTLTLAVTRQNPDGTPKPITPEQIAAIEAGEICIFLAGRVYYRDVFGAPNWTDFGFSVTGPNAWTMPPVSVRGFNRSSPV